MIEAVNKRREREMTRGAALGLYGKEKNNTNIIHPSNVAGFSTTTTNHTNQKWNPTSLPSPQQKAREI